MCMCIYKYMNPPTFQVLQVALGDAYLAHFVFYCLYPLKIINQTLLEQCLNTLKVPSKVPFQVIGKEAIRLWSI